MTPTNVTSKFFWPVFTASSDGHGLIVLALASSWQLCSEIFGESTVLLISLLFFALFIFFWSFGHVWLGLFLETPLDPGKPWKTPNQKWIKGTCRRTEREAEEARTWEYRLNRLVTLTAKAFPYLRWEER